MDQNNGLSETLEHSETSEYFLEVFESVTEKLAEPSINLAQDTDCGEYRVMIYFPLETRLMVGWIEETKDWQEKNFTVAQVKEACLFYANLFTNV